MQIDESDEHRENAPFPIHDSRDPDSNVTVEREEHPQKQYSPTFVTDAGMQIDEIDKQSENASRSMHETLQPDSNLTLETVQQCEKQLCPKVST
jgi:hypothetical protein